MDSIGPAKPVLSCGAAFYLCLTPLSSCEIAFES